jgi:hypothetical protein
VRPRKRKENGTLVMEAPFGVPENPPRRGI